jgi:hypothetical protein
MMAQKAHWYRITSGSYSDSSSTLMNQVFPLMKALLSIDPEVMHSMLQKCGLCFERKGVFSPHMNSWQTFIAEYCIDIEVTTFCIKAIFDLLEGKDSEAVESMKKRSPSENDFTIKVDAKDATHGRLS